MKKLNFQKITSLLLLTFVSGCNITTTSSSNTSSSTTSSSISSSVTKKLSFEEMLENISNQNITYHSDYLIYYYEDEEDLIELQRFDIYSKITEEVYEMKAYVYGTKNIASYAHLEKDNEGYVVSSDINIKNELIRTRVVDGTNHPFLWEESVYYNLITYLDVEDFEEINETTYAYTGDLRDLPVSIIHTAIPVSTFDLELLTVTVKDNEIVSFNFYEEESDDVYKGYMYGRQITLTFEDIDNTTVKRVLPYEEKEENDALGYALEAIRGYTNYSIISEGILNDNSKQSFQETYITEKDIYQVQHSDSGIYYTGCHTYNDELYIYEKVGDYLLGTKANSDLSISSFLPTFDFSEDVFEFVEEKDGYRVYNAYSSMTNVLNYIDVLGQYSESYYPSAGPIQFFVKDNTLSKIEFPIYSYIDGEAIVITNRFTYQNVGTTVIPTSWSNFVTELPSSNITSWNDEAYLFDFELSNGTTRSMTVGAVITMYTGNVNSIPYFIPSNIVVEEVYGGESIDDNVAYFALCISHNVNQENVTIMTDVLVNAGFEKEGSYSSGLISLIKDDIYLVFMITDGNLEIFVNLPLK